MRAAPLFGLTCCMLALSMDARADEIRITNPVGGTFRNGAVLTIKWDYTFLEHYPKTADEKKMDILLRHYDTAKWVGTIATVDVLARRLTWTIGNVKPGIYVLYFGKSHAPLMGTCAISEPFTIEAGQQPALPSPVASIRITSPVAGKSYNIGSTVKIQWDTARIANQPTVWLSVCWPDGKPAAGAFPAPNTGSYEWLVAEAAENALRICISTIDKKLKGMSGTFFVTFPSKPHVSPAGAAAVKKKH